MPQHAPSPYFWSARNATDERVCACVSASISQKPHARSSPYRTSGFVDDVVPLLSRIWLRPVLNDHAIGAKELKLRKTLFTHCSGNYTFKKYFH